jgi:hypothetical protein
VSGLTRYKHFNDLNLYRPFSFTGNTKRLLPKMGRRGPLYTFFEVLEVPTISATEWVHYTDLRRRPRRPRNTAPGASPCYDFVLVTCPLASTTTTAAPNERAICWLVRGGGRTCQRRGCRCRRSRCFQTDRVISAKMLRLVYRDGLPAHADGNLRRRGTSQPKLDCLKTT